MIYETLCDKRKDQITGFWAFIVLNAILILASPGFVFETLWPWIINGLILLISLKVRPHFAVGFLISMAGFIAASLIYVISCNIACSGYESGSGSDLSALIALVCPTLIYPLYLYWAVRLSRQLYREACTGEGQAAPAPPVEESMAESQPVTAFPGEALIGEAEMGEMLLPEASASPNEALMAVKTVSHRVIRQRFLQPGLTLAGILFIAASLLARDQTRVIEFTEWIYSVAFSPDGHWLVSGGWNDTLHLWDFANLIDSDQDDPGTARAVLTNERFKAHNSVAFSPDGRWLASGSSDNEVYLQDLSPWIESDTADLPAAKELDGQVFEVFSVAFSPDGRWLASGGGGPGREGVLCLWDLSTILTEGSADSTGAPTFSHRGPMLESISFSPDGRWLASGDGDNMVNLWDLTPLLETGAGDQITTTTMLVGHRGRVKSVAFSPNGRWLASGGQDGAVRLWDLTPIHEAEPPHRLHTRKGLGSHTESVTSVAFSADGRWLASGSADRTVRVWEVATILETDDHKPMAVLRSHKDGVASVAFSPDGRWLVSGSRDATLRLWDTTALTTTNHNYTARRILTILGILLLTAAVIIFAIRQIWFPGNNQAPG